MSRVPGSIPRIIVDGFCKQEVFSYFVEVILLNRSKNIKLILNYVIGPLVFCVLAYSIYKQLLGQPDWKHSLWQITAAREAAGQLSAVLLLMLANWGIEAGKWQLALAPIQRISFITSYKAIFSGATLAFFTPNRTGEYFGRMLHIKEENRMRSIAITVVCSMSQLLVTLLAGIAGLLYLSKNIAGKPNNGTSVLFWLDILLYVVATGTIFLTIVYFRLTWLVRWIKKIPKIEKYLTYVRALDEFSATILLRILSLSIIRFLIFIVQYYLIFQVFDLNIDWWQSFWAVSVVFLAMAIAPSIGVLTELGIRWKISLEVIRFFSNNMTGILAASLAVWIINLVIPALIGSLLILRLRIFNNRRDRDIFPGR